MGAYFAVGALLLIVGACGDAVAAHFARSRRGIWLTAIALMCILPPLLLLVPRGNRTPPTVTNAVQRIDRAIGNIPRRLTRMPKTSPSASPSASSPHAHANVPTLPSTTRARAADSPRDLHLDAWLAGLWASASVVLASLLLNAARRLRDARRTWTPAPRLASTIVLGITGRPTRVWASSDVGPAAFGMREAEVVLPAWAVTSEEPERTLLLAHEATHIAAHDTLALGVVVVLVVLVPWHLPLLIATRRLRRAIEMDCDARVLARAVEPAAYARLLIDTAERLHTASPDTGLRMGQGWMPGAVLSLAGHRSELETRLRALIRPLPSWPRRVGVMASASVGVGALLATGTVPVPRVTRTQPELPSPRPAVTRAVTARPSVWIDSVTRYDSLQREIERRIAPRMNALRDTVIARAARATTPAAFARTGTTSDVWILLSPEYDVLATTEGAAYNYEYPGDLDTMRLGTLVRLGDLRPATPQSPRARLVARPESFLRAFRVKRVQDIDASGAIPSWVGRRFVTVHWARLTATAQWNRPAERVDGSEAPRASAREAKTRDAATARGRLFGAGSAPQLDSLPFAGDSVARKFVAFARGHVAGFGMAEGFAVHVPVSTSRFGGRTR